MKMLKIEELRRKIEKCHQMDKNVHLRTGPKWTARNNPNCTNNNNNSIINFIRDNNWGSNRR